MIAAQARRLLYRLVHPEGDPEIKVLRRDVRRLLRRVEELEAAHRDEAERLRRADRTSAQLRLTTLLNQRQREDVERLPSLLDEQGIAAHVRGAIASAPLLIDPYEHILVERLLPDDVYELLIRAIPPAEFFDDRDRTKQNLVFPMELGPTLPSVAWAFMDRVIAQQIVRPAVLEKFHAPLQEHFATVFGRAFVEQANALPQSAHGGRLMLRRPGYHLGPHRDPKRAMLTCLLYFARPGDSEAHGTQLFRVHDDAEASYKTTYYPAEEGRRCELVKLVPFRPNTMLVSLNSRGAHGAVIPPDAPAHLERYTYQFYVAPDNRALGTLIKSLPPAQRAMWNDKAQATAEWA
jgi:hypothetical protein